MAASKEAIAIVLDVGPSMCSAPPGEATPLQTSIQAITMILQRKMFSESKDEVALILFGTSGTDNPLTDGEAYENVTIARHLGVADFDLLGQVQNDITPGDTPADFIDAMIIAMDHLESGLQGKRGFGSKRLIVMSDLCSPFSDDKLETFISVIPKFSLEVNFIGPDLDDEEEEGAGGDGGDSDVKKAPPGGKDKTPQQRAGEAMARYIVDKSNGAAYSFNEALPALSFFQSRQVRPTAWKAVLEIGANLKIPVNGFIKIKDNKLKQSWKKVYARDVTKEIRTERTFHLDDEEETEIEKEEIVEGYCYGSDRVPMTVEDKESMKYQSEKCFKVLGFTQADNVKRGQHMGDSCLSVSAEKGDEAAAVALSALIHALYETNCVAVARRVYAARSAPRIGCLYPHIKAEYECLYWVELPFAEDVRTFTFGSLPLKDDATTNKKYAPSADQLKAVDDLITAMDLSQAAENEDGEKCEALKPKLTFNPYFQRVYQCLQHRALNPDEPLPELSPLIAASLKRPAGVEAAAREQGEPLRKLFKLEAKAGKKEEQTGQAVFKQNGSTQPEVKEEAKPSRSDADLEGGIEAITKAKVTEVGTVTPIDDFRDLISRKDEDLFEKACEQLQQRINQMVADSFGAQSYGKALDCVKVLRAESVKKAEPNAFNDFIQDFKDTLQEKERLDFWRKVIEAKQCLISSEESPESDISKEEAVDFLESESQEQEAAPPKEEAEPDDLLADL